MCEQLRVGIKHGAVPMEQAIKRMEDTFTRCVQRSTAPIDKA